MEKVCNIERCMGCMACENICPVNAIEKVKNDRGFYEPKINKKICINCKMCQSVCPEITDIVKVEPIRIYACKNKEFEARMSSSSGGTFLELAKKIFESDGSVYGAAFNDENKVVHIKAENEIEFEPIKKSKYVQSDVGNIYESLEEDLKKGRKVIFSGTPCQVQAALNLNEELRENLYLIDVVCHGVPSPGIFEDYKKYLENKYNSKIIKINFRYKTEKSTQNIKVDFENGETYISSHVDGDLYYSLFADDISLRQSCYDCKFKSFERISDVSLADFWGYRKGPAENFGDNKGVSLILINTHKGLELFEQIKNKIDYMEINREDCEPYNCFKNFVIPSKREDLWNDYLSNGIETLISKNGAFRD